jgi:hypothetical protein
LIQLGDVAGRQLRSRVDERIDLRLFGDARGLRWWHGQRNRFDKALECVPVVGVQLQNCVVMTAAKEATSAVLSFQDSLFTFSQLPIVNCVPRIWRPPLTV